MVWIWF